MSLDLNSALFDGTKKLDWTHFYSDISFLYKDKYNFYLSVNGNERVLMYEEGKIHLYKHELAGFMTRELFTSTGVRKDRDLPVALIYQTDIATIMGLLATLKLIKTLGSGELSTTAFEHLREDKAFHERRRTWITAEQEGAEFVLCNKLEKTPTAQIVGVYGYSTNESKGLVANIPGENIFANVYGGVLFFKKDVPDFFNNPLNSNELGSLNQSKDEDGNTIYRPKPNMAPYDHYTPNDYIKQLTGTQAVLLPSKAKNWGIARDVRTNLI